VASETPSDLATCLGSIPETNNFSAEDTLTDGKDPGKKPNRFLTAVPNTAGSRDLAPPIA
jgi:hypothetical protein